MGVEEFRNFTDYNVVHSREVTEVVSVSVCAMLCLREERVPINGWSYNGTDRKCSCAWIKMSLAEESCLVEDWITNRRQKTAVERLDFGEEEFAAFLLVSQFVPCRK